MTTAKAWKDYLGLSRAYVQADPSRLPTSPALHADPSKVRIDLRNMVADQAYTGDPYDSQILPLAKANHGPESAPPSPATI